MSTSTVGQATIAFCHIQRTAGTTLNQILRRSFGLRHCDVERWQLAEDYYTASYTAADHRWVRLLHPLLVSIAGHQVKPLSDLENVCPDLRYYTFMRDPVRRTASHYQHNVKVMGYLGPFNEWVKREAFHDLQSKHLAGDADANKAIEVIEEKQIFVGLTERFD